MNGRRHTGKARRHYGVFVAFLGLVISIPASLFANPGGAVVRHGDIQILQSGNTLKVIQQGSHGIIDWNSFSISDGEVTRFSQPGSSAATLNRVTGQDLSRIDGSLLANGRIFLLNPNGVVIGPGGRVDTAGFTASTLDLSNENFLEGGDLNFRGESAAAVVNLGEISSFEGDVFLLAESVLNEGTIRAPQGTVGLAAGNNILISESGNERVFVRGAGAVQEDGVVNRGVVEANIAELKAHGGNVYGMAVKNEGRVAATGVTQEGGQIFLRAGGSSGIRSTGQLIARPVAQEAPGTPMPVARVVVDAGSDGRVEIDGEVDVSSEAGKGGDIFILGREVDLFSESLILADGESAGGRIYVGGGRRGENPELMNATNVTIASGATLDASAGEVGNGGEVILFAEDTLSFQGDVSARGGGFSGDGGFIEISGKNALLVSSLSDQVHLEAPGGKGGTLLIDPNDILIVDGTSPGPIGPSPVNQNTLMDADIENFLSSASLVIETDKDSISGSGDITVQSGASISWSQNNDLTFNAERDFVMQGEDVESSMGASMINGGGNLVVNAGRAIDLEGSIGMQGSVSLNANRNPTATDGDFDGVTINGQIAANGNVSIYGTGGNADGNHGVVIGSPDWGASYIISSSSGDIHISGETRAPTGSSERYGVVIEAPIYSGGSYHSISVDVESGDFRFGPNGNLLSSSSSITGTAYDEDTIYSFGGSVIPMGLTINDYGSSEFGDTLDFSQFTGPLVIDLENSTMGVGSFGGIESFVGSGTGSVIQGGSQNDLITIDRENGGTIEVFAPSYYPLETEGPKYEETFYDYAYVAPSTTYSFQGFEGVQGKGGDDSFTVQLEEGEHFGGILDGGEGDDLFEIIPGGSVEEIRGEAGHDTLSFRMFSESVVVDYSKDRATQVNFFKGINALVGGSGKDTIRGTNDDDVIEITGVGSGTGRRQGHSTSTFESFEIIDGKGGDDRFIFRNQATVDLVIGGGGYDSFIIDDTDLGGTNLYTIGENRISRNPQYYFSGVELLQLLLGPGDDTVVSSGNGLTQLLNGGGGSNSLNFGGAVATGSNPFFVGGSTILASNFVVTGELDNVGNGQNSQVVLDQQTGNVFTSQGGDDGPPGAVIDNFSGGSGSNNLMSGNTPGGGGNAFGAASAGIAAQASITMLDGTIINLDGPIEMGGAGVPPAPVLEELRESLGIGSWKELANAIEFIGGGVVLVNADGAYAIDLSEMPPAEILELLRQSMMAAAHQELLGALGMNLAIPLTSEDGPIGILNIPIQLDPETVALLDEMLNGEAFDELTAALGNG
ncbi:MAG: filamentous hemagglutinin N-terminal domain-containing protein [Verrucomicrobiales bacterium]|nr:filamentous hemagglutinin N-terminal domain-containing protein [Verrucomicrobiales bacterium]